MFLIGKRQISRRRLVRFGEAIYKRLAKKIKLNKISSNKTCWRKSNVE